MVQRGSPELPGDCGDNLHTNGTYITNYGQNTSDESEEEGAGTSYEGYEPLPLGDDPMQQQLPQEDEEEEADNYNDPNMPNIVNSDVEIERQIWSEPRPQVLNLELDSTRTEQIMSAMANITLPNSAIPDWAQGVPEERWKQDLLERIRLRSVGSPQGESSSKLQE